MHNDDLMEMVGNNIRSIRLSKKMSLEEVAKAMDITPGYLGLMERGKRGISAKYIYKLSNIFNAPIYSFYIYDEAKTKQDNQMDMIKNKIMYALSGMSEKELNFIMQVVINMKDLSE